MIRNNNIPQGFKQTELSVIPEGWESISLNKIGNFSKGTGISREEMHTGNIPAIRYGEIYTSHNDYIKIFYSHINADVARRAKQLSYGDILFACSGETKEEIGKSVAYISDNVAYAGGDIIILSPNQYYYDPQFIGYATNAPYAIKQKSSKGQGDAIVHISKESLADITLWIPKNKGEQKRIAKALSDMDALITALNKKIEKKRLIKQGAMQQLLTGKKRLDGFCNAWKEIELGNNAIMNSGGTPASSNLEYYYGGKIPFLSIGDITVAGKYVGFTEKTITQKGFNNSSARMFPAGTIMYAMYASLGKCTIADIDLACSQAILGIIPSETIDSEYLYYYLSFIEDKVKDLGQTGTQTNLSKRIVQEFILNLPRDVAEQQAIATILSDMDKEIAVLEVRRDKYKQIKSGMMQKLLTGQIRLINRQSAPMIPLGSALAVPREFPVQAHIVAGHIVNKLHESKGWGRTKLQKSLHLIGYHCQLDFGNEYIRNTAGPDDQLLMRHIDTKFKQYRHVQIVEQKDANGRKHYDYRPNEGSMDEVEMAFERYPIEMQNRINELLAKFEQMDLGHAEIVSTLYAVWNNRLIKHEPIIDDLLLEDFYAWSKHKSDFSRDLVLHDLNYMRKEGIIPIGWGKYIDKK